MDVLESFEHFCRQKRYAQAMLIAEKHPELRATELYAELQEIFLQHLQLAALYIKRGDVQKAKEIVGEFVRLQEKRVGIQLLLQHKERFLEFVRHVAYGEVYEAYAISLEDERYKELGLYKELVTQMERLLERYEAAINEGEAISQELLERLLPYPRAKRLLKKHRLVAKLHTFFDAEDYDGCYALLHAHSELHESLLGSRLQHYWYETLHRCEEHAQKGELQQLVTALGPLLHVKTKQKEVGMLLRKAARIKTQLLIQKQKYQEAERSIYSYLELFGKDALFVEVMQEFARQSGKEPALMPEFEKQEERWQNML